MALSTKSILGWTGGREADHALAVSQWQDLRRHLEEAGAAIECMEPKKVHAGPRVYRECRGYIFGKIAVARPLSPGIPSDKLRNLCSGMVPPHDPRAAEAQEADTVFRGAAAMLCSMRRCAPAPDIRIRTAIKAGHREKIGDLLGNASNLPRTGRDPARTTISSTCASARSRPGVAIYYPRAILTSMRPAGVARSRGRELIEVDERPRPGNLRLQRRSLVGRTVVIF